MLIDLRQLTHSVAAADRSNPTRAAWDFHTTRWSRSARVRALERDLAVPVVHRNTDHVDLTPAGAALLLGARALLGDADLAADASRGAGDAGDPGSTSTATAAAPARPPSDSCRRRATPAQRGSCTTREAAQVPRLHSGELDGAVGRAHELPDGLEHGVVRHGPRPVMTRSDRSGGADRVHAEDLHGLTLRVGDRVGPRRNGSTSR